MAPAVSLPAQHFCVWHERSGPSSVIVEGMLPMPTRSCGEVLIAVRATSVNPKDWKGRIAASPGCKSLLGEDVAGVVVACDPSSPFPVGTRVFAMMNMLAWRGDTRFFKSDGSYVPKSEPRRPESTAAGAVRWGASGQYVPIEERFVARIPDNVSFEEAASVPLVALTALQNLRNAGLGAEGSPARSL